jgi:hypothetical protein
MDFDIAVKMAIYKLTAKRGKIPNSTEVSNELGVSNEDVKDAFERLYALRLLVLEPDDRSKIRMAPPFSGIETSFRVEVDGKSYYANCVWDAFGVAAALQRDGIIYTSDGFTNEPLILEINDNKPTNSEYIAHFAVPAAHWWDDIIYT